MRRRTKRSILRYLPDAAPADGHTDEYDAATSVPEHKLAMISKLAESGTGRAGNSIKRMTRRKNDTSKIDIEFRM